jgi:hypothetical protein
MLDKKRLSLSLFILFIVNIILILLFTGEFFLVYGK